MIRNRVISSESFTTTIVDISNDRVLFAISMELWDARKMNNFQQKLTLFLFSSLAHVVKTTMFVFFFFLGFSHTQSRLRKRLIPTQQLREKSGWNYDNNKDL